MSRGLRPLRNRILESNRTAPAIRPRQHNVRWRGSLLKGYTMRLLRFIIIGTIAACSASVVVAPPADADDCQCQNIEMTAPCVDGFAEFALGDSDWRGASAWTNRDDGSVFGPAHITVDGGTASVRCDSLGDSVVLWLP